MSQSVDSPMRFEVNGSVASITLDSQHNRNALSRAMLLQMHEALDEAARLGVRVVQIRAVGPSFCSGFDLKERVAGGEHEEHDEVPDIFERLVHLELPVIAIVDGAVRAAGMGLIAASDVALSTPRSTFAASEVRRGLVPTTLAALCVTRMNVRLLQRYFLTGDVFDAVEAASVGLVTTVVSEHDIDAQAASLAQSLCAGGPLAVASTKHALWDLPGMEPQTALEEMQAALRERFASEEAMEGMSAFVEKRLPRWQADVTMIES